MKAVTAAQMREMDRLATTEFAIPGEVLMDRAGFCVAHIVDDLARMAGFTGVPVRIVAGCGNNGGDAFVAARYLRERDYAVEVFLAGSRSRLRGDALKHFERLRAAQVKVEELDSPQQWEGLLPDDPGDAIVVDGVLGTGAAGPARGAAAAAIGVINTLGNFGPVLAIDIPSGLDADTGAAQGDAVRADVTVTMALPKRGLLAPRALEHVGNVEVADIGFPAELVARFPAEREMIAAADIRALLRRRARESHKGSYGHLLIVAGAPGFAGAAGLCARAALRSGAGLVTVLTPRGVQATVAAMAPEAMVHGGDETAEGCLRADALRPWLERQEAFSALAIGPGLTQHPEIGRLVRDVLAGSRIPVVADADALNVLAGSSDATAARRSPLVITPHPGEMGRLMGVSAAEVQARRAELAGEATGALCDVCVLKGAGTVVAGRDRLPHINMNGNPGMARGGMGDALTGLIGGLVAQGLASFDAARAGVFIHGRAGDHAAWAGAQYGMIAGDVIEEFVNVFAELTPR